MFRLFKRGLVVIEHTSDHNQFMVVRPRSLAGSTFRGWEGECNVGMSGTSLSTNAPPAMLQPKENGWLIDISIPAAPGPGPVYFNAEFATSNEAVEAILDCYFGDRVENSNESLAQFYGPDADS